LADLVNFTNNPVMHFYFRAHATNAAIVNERYALGVKGKV